MSKPLITVTCYRRLAPFLAAEIEQLGYEVESTFATGVQLRGSLADCVRLNLSLRCASHVLFSLKKFEAATANDIYYHVSAINWEDIIPAEGYFSVSGNVQNDTIHNSMFANLKVKDAIVDRVRNKMGKRPSSGAEVIGAAVHLYWKGNEAEIFIDTTGHSLSKHGYRKLPGQAPMLESLAAATVLATVWDKRSPFVNPMCGSGTLAIEAALIATNTAPGLFRDNFAFMHILGYNEDFYFNQCKKLEDEIIDVTDLQIIATDHSYKAVDEARKNAKAAGVADYIRFDVCDFTATHIPQNENGVVMLNPEYGERLGDEQSLETTYAQIGDFMKQKCKGYNGYIFTGNLDLAKKVGLKPKRKIEFYTGTIDCRLFEYELYDGTRKMK